MMLVSDIAWDAVVSGERSRAIMALLFHFVMFKENLSIFLF
jgi:hypothetical protein